MTSKDRLGSVYMDAWLLGLRNTIRCTTATDAKATGRPRKRSMVWATGTLFPVFVAEEALLRDEQRTALVQLAGIRSQRSPSSSGLPVLCPLCQPCPLWQLCIPSTSENRCTVWIVSVPLKPRGPLAPKPRRTLVNEERRMPHLTASDQQWCSDVSAWKQPLLPAGDRS